MTGGPVDSVGWVVGLRGAGMVVVAALVWLGHPTTMRAAAAAVGPTTTSRNRCRTVV